MIHKLLIHTFFSVSLLLGATNALANNNGVKSKPNILFVAVDDLTTALGSYGNNEVYTPNIDQLATQGTLFTKAYAQFPVCGPSRVSVFTGQRPETNGIVNMITKMRKVRPDIVTMPEYLKSHGYITAAAGKVFDLRNVDSRKGGDAPSWSIPFKVAPKIYEGKERYAVKAIDKPNSSFSDGKINQRAKMLLNKMAKKDAPFFLAVGYKKPHLPFVAPKQFFDLYNPKELTLANFQALPLNANEKYLLSGSHELRTYFPDYQSKGKKIPYPAGSISQTHQRELMHGYYASVSYVDHMLGELLEELDKLGKRDNTIIVLWSDHGFHLGDHGTWGKHTTMEQANRVPLIISLPKQPERTYTKPVELMDLFPTLLDLANIPKLSQLQGDSLAGILIDNNTVDKVAISQFIRRGAYGYTMRTNRYRYTEWVNSKNKIVYRDLYDLELDPQETVNIINIHEHKNLVKELSQTLRNNSEGLLRLNKSELD